MSFSNDVKHELSYSAEKIPRHCCLAEILGFVSSKAHILKKYKRVFLFFETDNLNSAKRIFDLICDTFQIRCHISIKSNTKMNRKSYCLFLSSQKDVIKLLKAVLLYNENGEIDKNNINPLMLKDACCKRAFIRGIFFTCGGLSDPEKNYHLEFIFLEREKAEFLCKVMNNFSLAPKIIKRKNYFVLYLKEAENIVDMLNIIGAHGSLLEFENIRVLKDVSNNINRAVNCETANLSKTISASVSQIEDINFILEKEGMSYLPEQLQEIAALRLTYPNASFKEIGEKLTPKISKSGVNHRLKRISKIAEKLRRD